jgi:hypothetical protein
MTTADNSARHGEAATMLSEGASVAAGGRLPNLIIAGVTKAGTTSLFRYLSQHPDICAADEKELRYFLPLRYGQPLPPIDGYARHFGHCGEQPYAMEASPGYFYGGRDVAVALDSTLREPRVLILLREPSSRCWSFYNFMRSRTRLPQSLDFDHYLDRCVELHRDGVDQQPEQHEFSGLGGGCYADWIEPWLETFGDRVRIEFFEDLVADPAGTVAGLCAWLGLDADVAAAFKYHVENKTEQFRHKGLQQAALRLNRANVLFFERHQAIKRLLRRLYYVANRAPGGPRPSPTARRRLDDFYAPYNRRLADLLAPSDRTRGAEWLRSSD